jgi:hypothetical protein
MDTLKGRKNRMSNWDLLKSAQASSPSNMTLAFYADSMAATGPVRDIEIFSSTNDGFAKPTFSGVIHGQSVYGHIVRDSAGPFIRFVDSQSVEVATAYALIPFDSTLKTNLVMQTQGKEISVNISDILDRDIVTRFCRHAEPDEAMLARVREEMKYKKQPPNVAVLHSISKSSSSFEGTLGGLEVYGSVGDEGIVRVTKVEMKTGQVQSTAQEVENHKRAAGLATKSGFHMRW